MGKRRDIKLLIGYQQSVADVKEVDLRSAQAFDLLFAEIKESGKNPISAEGVHIGSIEGKVKNRGDLPADLP